MFNERLGALFTEKIGAKESMMKDNDCIFCKIVDGEIPSTVVYENDHVLAFEDLNPMMPTHVLIIPKNHYKNIIDDIPADEMANLMAAIKDVARIKGIDESGFRVIINTNDDACQTVHHVHVHVLGGAKMNEGNPSLDA